MIGPHYGEWWNERPGRVRLRLALVLGPVLLLLIWGVHAALSGPTSRLRALRGGRTWRRRRGADPNARSRFYGTPLHWAADSGRGEAAALLIARGARPTAVDDHRLTSVERARRRGHMQTAALMIAAGTPGERAASIGASRERAATTEASSTVHAGCALPRHTNLASRGFLHDYLEGDPSVAEFRRLFSLPNSEYLGVGRCLVALYE